MENKNWIEIDLGEVAKINAGYGFPETLQGRADGDYPFYKVKDISRAILSGSYLLTQANNYISKQDLISLKASAFSKGTIVFAKIGEALRLNRRAILSADALVDNNVMGVKANDEILNGKFLYYFLLTVDLGALSQSTTVPAVRKSDVGKIRVPIPPLAEQQRIVAKLDELMEKIDRSRARLERIPKILKRLRQSVLAAAVSGKLTEEWREKNNVIGEWKEMVLKDVITDKPKNGFSAKPVKHKTKFRVLTLTATTSGRFIPDHFKYFDEPIESNSQFWLQPNDILVQRGNTLEYVGVSAIYDGKPNQFIYPDLMMRLRVNELITTKYLYYFLSSESTRNYLRERATGTSGNMPKINQPTLMEVPISLPGIMEQNEIVRRVDQLFSLDDKIETRYLKAKSQLDRLPQSLLAKAFRGDLVAQDEIDEPAIVLLDKIRKVSAQRDLTSKKPKKIPSYA